MSDNITQKKRTVIRLFNGGANRGARKNLNALVNFNKSSASRELVPVYIDPAPGRAQRLAEEAQAQGVAAEAVEGTIESITRTGDDARVPRVLNLDRASAVASVLQAETTPTAPTLIYMILKLPGDRLLGLRSVLRPGERHDEAVALFKGIASVSERAGSGVVLGSHPVHELTEPALRNWFAEHTQRELGKLVAGLEPESAPFELTDDGEETRPLLVVERATWGEPRAVVAEAIVSPASPLRRGGDFTVVEVTPEGVRFHDARARHRDGRVVVRASVDDRITVRADEERALVHSMPARDTIINTMPALSSNVTDAKNEGAAELVQAFATLLDARVRSDTLSVRNPIATTD